MQFQQKEPSQHSSAALLQQLGARYTVSLWALPGGLQFQPSPPSSFLLQSPGRLLVWGIQRAPLLLQGFSHLAQAFCIAGASLALLVSITAVASNLHPAQWGCFSFNLYASALTIAQCWGSLLHPFVLISDCFLNSFLCCSAILISSISAFNRMFTFGWSWLAFFPFDLSCY